MSSPARLDQQIADLSGGRLTYDARNRRLTYRGAAGTHELEISETDLRTLLQRLLLSAPPEAQGESLQIAVDLLVEQLEGLA